MPPETVESVTLYECTVCGDRARMDRMCHHSGELRGRAPAADRRPVEYVPRQALEELREWADSSEHPNWEAGWQAGFNRGKARLQDAEAVVRAAAAFEDRAPLETDWTSAQSDLWHELFGDRLYAYRSNHPAPHTPERTE